MNSPERSEKPDMERMDKMKGRQTQAFIHSVHSPHSVHSVQKNEFTKMIIFSNLFVVWHTNPKNKPMRSNANTHSHAEVTARSAAFCNLGFGDLEFIVRPLADS